MKRILINLETKDLIDYYLTDELKKYVIEVEEEFKDFIHLCDEYSEHYYFDTSGRDYQIIYGEIVFKDSETMLKKKYYFEYNENSFEFFKDLMNSGLFFSYSPYEGMLLHD